MVMVTFTDLIKHRFPNADLSLGGNCVVSDDGSGPKITRWNEAKLGPQPTPDFLEAKRAEVEAALEAQRQKEAAENANKGTMQAAVMGDLDALRTYATGPNLTTILSFNPVLKAVCRVVIRLALLQLNRLDRTN